MIFNEFWTLLQDELSHEQEFATLKQGKKFKARFEINTNEEKVVIITTEHSGTQRGPISYNEFEGTWNNVKDSVSRETRFVNFDRSYTRKDGKTGKSIQNSYIAKLIDHIVKDHSMQ